MVMRCHAFTAEDVSTSIPVCFHHEADGRLREEVLQLVVGVVDHELLEAVDREHLQMQGRCKGDIRESVREIQ